MAQNKKRGRPPKSTSTQNRTRSNSKPVTNRKSVSAEKKSEHNQVISVVLFALSIFFLFINFIKGQSIWNFLHTSFRGIFGISTYFLPIILIIIAINFAKDATKSSVIVKIIQSILCTGFFAAFCHLCSARVYEKGINFTQYISEVYTRGVNGDSFFPSSGGVFGALFGEPLWLLFGVRACAIIVILILAFIFIMLATNTSILSLFKPFKSAKERGREIREERRIAKEEALLAEAEDDFGYQDISKIPVRDGDVIINYDGDDATDDKADFDMVTDMPDHPVDSDYDSAKKHLDEIIEEELPKKRRFGRKPKEEEKVKEEKKAEKKSSNPNSVGAPVIEMEEDGYRFPPMNKLDLPASGGTKKATVTQLHAVAEKLVETLRSFRIESEITNISVGPSVTRFELRPAPGVKVSRITNLSDDIALAIAAQSIRIEAPIPGKSAVGIEVPNETRSTVHLREVIDSDEFMNAKSKLTVALGKNISGEMVLADLAKMPHTLIAGTTGSGKSVCINSIILSILYKASPTDVRLILIDPKMVELGGYNGIPHLLVPVVTDPRRAAGTLGWAVNEMEKRYKCFAENGVKDLKAYNELAKTRDDITTMPKILIIIDELADLMMVSPKEVEDYIIRLAQKARAAGVHLLLATQRPSVDVITGMIKTNIPSRIAFSVKDGMNSRIILDQTGAEKLIGMGDMLFSPIGSVKPDRVQGCFVSDAEKNRVLDFVKKSAVEYDEEVQAEIDRQVANANEGRSKASGESDDPLAVDDTLMKAIELAVNNGELSTSYLQRKLGMGYARAARTMDELEERGIVGEARGSKPREVLITKEQFMEMQNSGEDF
jgi:S-DNA-T family DNA segregation ATPase FtsK/SpoIIIE